MAELVIITRPYADYDPVDKNQPILGANDGASGVAVDGRHQVVPGEDDLHVENEIGQMAHFLETDLSLTVRGCPHLHPSLWPSPDIETGRILAFSPTLAPPTGHSAPLCGRSGHASHEVVAPGRDAPQPPASECARR